MTLLFCKVGDREILKTLPVFSPLRAKENLKKFAVFPTKKRTFKNRFLCFSTQKHLF